MTEPRRRLPWWPLVAGLAVFAVFAANFLYFFVDDEGIAFVYARHLLAGKGLAYNSIEGHVEGYTNFLDVLMNAAILRTVEVLHRPRATVFFVGKGISLLAGLATIALSFAAMRRLRDISLPGLAAGVALLATAGPLAVWSCSSLEAVPFTALLTLLVYALISAASDESQARRFDRMALAAAVLACLERLDGPLLVGAIGGAWFVAADGARRAAMLRRIVLPAAVAAALYHGWRIWYFDDWLNMPVYAKVLYKFGRAPHLVVKAPAEAYWRQFADDYGWPALAIFLACTAAAAFRNAAVRPTFAAALALAGYAARVGDWMFGSRFLLPVLPLSALLLAQTVSVLWRLRPRIAWGAAAVVTLWCGYRAILFERKYEVVEGRPSWLLHPSGDSAAYFTPYEAVRREMARHVPRGSRVAYNQAGFVPFMLDLDNIDDLGICSRFYAQLPTRDVFFTEVGRYAPLTAKPIIEATEAYLLYQDVSYVIQRADLIRAAHGGRTPSELMGGYYTLLEAVGDSDVIYRRTDRDASEYKREPRLFTENLAHVARARAAVQDGAAVPYDDIPSRFPFLRGAEGRIGFSGQASFDVRFAETDLDVSEIAINQARATDAASVALELLSASGDVRAAARLDLERQSPRPLRLRLPEGTRGAALRVRIAGPGRRTSLFLDDLRVLGQTPELAAYIRRWLRFPPAQPVR